MRTTVISDLLARPGRRDEPGRLLARVVTIGLNRRLALNILVWISRVVGSVATKYVHAPSDMVFVPADAFSCTTRRAPQLRGCYAGLANYKVAD